ncbi:hypothetical protein Golax_021921 [Gossypium laxum]|uniref:Uncharacterized protein n=1 Tax=Gossypium laxum TaxID=34288 RepID=A0A7J9AMK1_9ROSI|nr:hypothetical protein [Gossypium laxum]
MVQQVVVDIRCVLGELLAIDWRGKDGNVYMNKMDDAEKGRGGEGELSLELEKGKDKMDEEASNSDSLIDKN